MLIFSVSTSFDKANWIDGQLFIRLIVTLDNSDADADADAGDDVGFDILCLDLL